MYHLRCLQFFTFRDAPKQKKEDDKIIEGLKKLQPVPAMNLQATVSAEKITGVTTIPSGACSGTLIASDPSDWKIVKCGTTSGTTSATLDGSTSGGTGEKIDGASRATQGVHVGLVTAAIVFFQYAVQY